MKYLKTEEHLGDAECSSDAVKSTDLLQRRLAELGAELDGLSGQERIKPLLDSGYILLDLERGAEAWALAREAFELAIPAALWERAVEACDVMFQADQPDSVKALGHGIWLGVTYPIDPELSVALLQHLVEDTPPNSDGAAVAAAAACYIVDLRARDRQRDELKFFTGQLLGQVARRHSKVEEQEIFEFWMERLQLNDPGAFLPHLATIVDTIVEGDWWFDRDALRDNLPED